MKYNKLLAVVALCAPLLACAGSLTADDTAALYAAGDGLSTHVALTSGKAVEANPLMPSALSGIVAVTVLKAGIPYVLKASGASPEVRKTYDEVASFVGGTAICNNLLVAAGVGTGQVWLPLAAGFVCGYFAMRDTAARPVDAPTAEEQP